MDTVGPTLTVQASNACWSWYGSGKSRPFLSKISRFGRNYKEVGSYLEQVFPFLGVRFISVNDGYDSNEYIGSTGGLDIACKALVHDLYSRDISRKVKSSRYARLRRGDYFCSVAPYGYVKSSEDKHRLVIDPPAAKVVWRIFRYDPGGLLHHGNCQNA